MKMLKKGSYPRVLKHNALFFSLLISGGLVHANGVFNPALLLNTDGAAVADLSKFEQGFQMPGTYQVSVYLNDDYLYKQELQFIQSDLSDSVSGGLKPCLGFERLNNMGVKLFDLEKYADLKTQKCIDLNTLIPETQINYNFSQQRIDISIPQIWIRHDARGYIPPSEWDEGITAGLLDYYINGGQSKSSSNFYAAFNAGFNIGGYRFRSLSNYNYYKNKNGEAKSKWENVQNYVEKSIIPLRSELVLGDSVNSNQIFDSVGFRGARLSSSEAMLPNTLQGYAPVVRGVAKSKSVVTIRQNGYIVYQTNVSQGPFEINDLSSMSMSGDLEVTIEESMGESQKFVVPYSGVPMLLREGRTEYDVTAGEFRSSNREQETPLFFQGTLSRGMKAGVTFYGGTQLSSDYQAYLVGLGKNMGRLGAFSLDMTHAESTLADNKDYRGQSYRFLYSKSLNDIGTTFQLLGYRYSTKGFYTLTDSSYKIMSHFQPEEKYDEYGNVYIDNSDYYNLNYTRKGQFQLNVNQNLNDFGSIYASMNHQSYWNTPRTVQTLQVGYAKAFKMVNVNLSWSQQESLNMHQDRNNVFSASVSLPLSSFYGNRSQDAKEVYSTSSYVNNSNGGQAFQTGVNGNLLENSQLNYNVTHGYDDQNGQFGGVAARINTRYGSSGASYNFSEDGKNKNLNYNVSGGAIIHSGGITFGQNLGDTNILVDAQGAKGVKLENSQNVHTDGRGYAIIPFAENYRLNRIALDADSLDDQTEILSNVQNLVPIRGAIMKASFESRIGHRALIQLSFNGKDVPYGSSITETTLGINSLVGQNSTTYLSGLNDKGQLKIEWGQAADESCVANYDFTQADPNSPLIRFELKCQ